LNHTLGGRVQVDWTNEPDLWLVYADVSQLELALMNLIINARDAMPDGGVIRVNCENKSIGKKDELGLDRGDYVLMAVVDNGAGIPKDIVDRVLEPFFTTKPVGKGTGLGLSMAYGFAKQSGGALRIESEEGHGTRIEIWLPRAKVLIDQQPVEPAQPVFERENNGALRILLVDDHNAARAAIAGLLQDAGHLVVEAGDALSLLGILKKSPNDYDVLVTDYAMPVLSGADLIKQARELTSNLRAIIITGYAEAELISSCPDDVQILMKPFQPEQLLEALKNLQSLSLCSAAAE